MTENQKKVKCEVCGKPVRRWGKPGTLAGCHRYLALLDGKVRTIYFGAVHRKCDRLDWPRQVENAEKQGWFVPNPSGQGYVVAPEYR